MGDQLSTLDLVRSRFTLLTCPGNTTWTEAAGRLGLPAHTVRMPKIPAGGALLVRPDGFIGRRAREHTPERLAPALDRLLSRGA
ncbi:hypothetical protein ACH4SK_14430 [Streptomyces inhibens]|uniref:aromatic-ring hydroxylase C-terminal domain-containing protein n=1 Tax=Streptomyces inhibens TaxID=2293571 RepID=UPI0037BA72D8